MYQTEKQYNESFTLLEELHEQKCNESIERVDKEWF